MPGRTLLVVCDYFSNFIKVERVRGVTKALKPVFARYGVPRVLVSNNGPQFDSEEFACFAKSWDFKHQTSSPRYPQSNGKAENAVKTVKRLFTKCRESGQSEYQALLDWRNTPTEGIGTSPVQRFLGRRCRTLLPTAGVLLQPRYSTEEDSQAIRDMKQRQLFYYNRHAKPLKSIEPGETIRMRWPGQSTWSAGTCTGVVGPKSYEVQVGEGRYRQNRRHLIRSNETQADHPMDNPEIMVDSETVDNSVRDSQEVDKSGSESEQKETTTQRKLTPPPPDTPPLRRSGRSRKPPPWMKDYIHS